MFNAVFGTFGSTMIFGPLYFPDYKGTRKKKKTGKLVTSAKKEGGGSGQNHDLRFL